MRMARWWWLTGGAFVAAGLGWWVVQVALLAPAQRNETSGYGQFVLSAIGVLLVVGGRVVKAFTSVTEDMDIEQFAAAVATAMSDRWNQAANEQRLVQPAPLPVLWTRARNWGVGPVDAAILPRTSTRPFDPLPGMRRITAGQLRRGGGLHTLHHVYGGLDSGRLLIVGKPGTGKSSAAILLLLDALHYRADADPEQRKSIPIPVLFTLQNWAPQKTSVVDWLSARIAEIPALSGRLSIDHAAALLRSGRISVFLDGLDEIPTQARPLALQALSEQSTFRLVLITRSTELAVAAQEHHLTGAAAVALRPLSPSTVADYLRHFTAEPAPPTWQQLVNTITKDHDHPLTKALASPLAVGLLRDTYPPNVYVDTAGVEELLDRQRFPEPRDVTSYLLDRAVTAAYTPRLGQPLPRYSPQTAQRTLTFLARHLNRLRTRDLARWTIPYWLPRTPRALLSAFFGAGVGALAGGLAFGWVGAITFGSVIGIMAGLRIAITGDTMPTAARTEWRQFITAPKLTFGLLAGVMVGLAGGLAFGPTAGIMLGLAAGLSVGPTVEINGMDLETPVQVWRIDLTVGLAGGLAIGLGIVFEGRPVSGLISGLAVGLAAGLPQSEVWNATITQIYLALRYRTPLRLNRFLADARSRNLLRAVGPIYQFRHASLQDRLASADTDLDN